VDKLSQSFYLHFVPFVRHDFVLRFAGLNRQAL